MRIIGISPAHDSSVAVVSDGEAELFLKEERLTRRKRDKNPMRSMHEALLRFGRGGRADGAFDFACTATPTLAGQGDSPPTALFVEKILRVPTVCYGTRHHLAHASLAFYDSGFEQALVFVIDRNGSLLDGNRREAETVFLASYPCGFEELHKNFWTPDGNFMSIVKTYESATTLIGQHPLENGKTMGLAAYGRDAEGTDLFADPDLFSEELFLLPNQKSVLLREHRGRIVRDVPREGFAFYADYAWQVQKQTQDKALALISEWVEKTGVRKVCVTGGYGLNVIANAHYLKRLPGVEFFFEPLADDAGNSLGAAMHLWRQKSGDTSIRPLGHTFFHGIPTRTKVMGRKVSPAQVAAALARGETIGVFEGLAEAGPRALGHRSILHDGSDPDAKETVNRIKRREWYRPFAAMVLEEDFPLHFDTLGLARAPDMTVGFPVLRPDEIPGVTHADGTCRVQTVDSRLRHIHALLSAFKEIAGRSVVLNTSMNLAGEPLVETQDEAVATFQDGGLDALWFPEVGCWLRRKAGASA